MTQQNKLEAIFKKLETDHFTAITVTDTNSGTVICCNKTAAALNAEYGGVTKFFENLISQKKHYVTIQERRQNGTRDNGTRVNYKSINEPMDFVIGKPEAVQAASSVMQVSEILPATPIHPTSQAMQMQGLNGMGGLMMPINEAIRLSVSDNEKTRLEVENNFLKQEVERLKKDNEGYKERELESKYSEAKAKGQSEMLMGAMPLLQPILEKLLGGGTSSSGMNAPAQQFEQIPISVAKEALLNVSEEMASFLLGIAERLSDVEFYNELRELLNKSQNEENANTGD